jgi:hypothetical protein
MSTPLPRNALRIPCELAWNPSDLNLQYPHGGTALGIVKDIEIRIQPRASKITAEEWGGQEVDAIYLGESLLVVAAVRGYDEDMIQRLFPNTDIGVDPIGNPGITRYVKGHAYGSGINRAGYLLSDRVGKLCVSPVAYDYHPMLILQAAIPMILPEAVLQQCWSRDLGMLVAFVGTPNSNGKVYEWGLKKDLHLT